MDESLDQERRQENRPNHGDAPFDAGEVFYSRTDPRGIIKAGNYVFRRVSAFDWDELIGAPHKIIRHPEMPKGVFWLFWNRLQNGQVVGAYVQNKAKDGLRYWVYALATPSSDGYLSARIKPLSDLVPQIQELYGNLRAAEREGMSPEESANTLLAELKKRGFANYDDFVAHSCAEELLAECDALGLPPDERVASAQKNVKLTDALAQETESLVARFEELSIVPHNLTLAASRLEAAGGPISTLSKNYGEISESMAKWFRDNVIGKDSKFSRIASGIKQAMVMECAAEVLHRCERQLLAERRELSNIDLESERKYLTDLASEYFSRAQEGTRGSVEEALRIERACDELTREILVLKTTRVACKIENARYAGGAAGLDDIIDQFGDLQLAIEGHLDEIQKKCAKLAAQWKMKPDDWSEVSDTLLYGEKMSAALAAESETPVEARNA